MNAQKTAVISVWSKNLGVAVFARRLYESGWRIVASQGTKKYLEGLSDIKVIETSEFTGLTPVLDHRVVTLCPQLHGGLLAEAKHLEELATLGWPNIDLVFVTFYPLLEKLNSPDTTFAEINEAVDIGGPGMVRSACKGGRIVITNEKDADLISLKIKEDRLTEREIRWLQAVAAAAVAQYQATETLFRVRKLQP